MATITKRSLASGYTNAQFMDELEQIFISAGWMTAWHDSYANSYPHIPSYLWANMASRICRDRRPSYF
jgi:hypothetical protein